MSKGYMETMLDEQGRRDFDGGISQITAELAKYKDPPDSITISVIFPSSSRLSDVSHITIEAIQSHLHALGWNHVRPENCTTGQGQHSVTWRFTLTKKLLSAEL